MRSNRAIDSDARERRMLSGARHRERYTSAVWNWTNMGAVALIWLMAGPALFDQTYGWWAGIGPILNLPVHSEWLLVFIALYVLGAVVLLFDILWIITRRVEERKQVFWLYPLILVVGLLSIWIPGDLASAATVRILGSGDRGDVLLSNAAGSGRLVTVRALLDAGVEADSRVPGGYTALHSAAGRGQVEVIRLLIDRGASVTIVGPNGLTPLHLAERSKNRDAVEVLLARGAKKYVEAQAQ